MARPAKKKQKIQFEVEIETKIVKSSDPDDDDDDTDEGDDDLADDVTCSKSDSKENNVPIDMAGLIGTKNKSLSYSVVGDMFTFNKSAGGGNMNLEFDKESTLEEMEFAKSALGRRSSEPTDEELSEINKLTSRSFKKEELRMLTIKAADCKVDRSFERFSLKALRTMADMSVGKPVMNDHDIRNVKETFGTIFNAKVVRMKDGPALIQKAYILNVPQNEMLIKSIEAGIGAQASVHFRVKREDYMCDLCKKTMFSEKGHCGHYTGVSKGENGEICTACIDNVSDFLETSRTAAPDQPGTDMKITSADDDIPETKSCSKSVKQPLKEVEPECRLLEMAKYVQMGAPTHPSTLAADSNKGARTVENDEKKQPGADSEEQKQQDAGAPAAASPAPAEDLVNFTKSVTKLDGSVDALKSAMSDVAESHSKTTEILSSFASAIEAEKSARSGQIKELNDRFEVLLQVHETTAKTLSDLSKKIDILSSKSIDELLVKIASVIPAAPVQQQAAKGTNDSYYEDLQSKILKARNRA